MNKMDMSLVAVSFLIFVMAPFLPTTLYKMSFSNALVPLILLVLLLLVVRKSPVGSIVLLLAIMSLFAEYRARVINMSVPSNTPPSYEAQLAPAPPIVPGEVHPEPAVPRGPMVTYKPSDDATNEFEPVDSTINTKKAMDSPRVPDDANKFLIQHGLV
jgi:hypothetical protein